MLNYGGACEFRSVCSVLRAEDEHKLEHGRSHPKGAQVVHLSTQVLSSVVSSASGEAAAAAACKTGYQNTCDSAYAS